MHFFEDFAIGQKFDLGTYLMTTEEILEFAQRFDPQPFHVDALAAADSQFGGLIASGWHTASAFMRLWVDGLLSSSASMGSPGVSDLRWLRPVRPGDELSGWIEVTGTRPSQTKPGRGTVETRGTVFNQNDEIVMTLESAGMFARRASA